MEMVEAPETMRPRAIHWPAARTDRQRIDAPMTVEAAVLVGLEQGEIDRIDVVDRGLEPPLAVGRREGAQQAAIGVDHLGRALVVAREVGREDPVERQRRPPPGWRRARDRPAPPAGLPDEKRGGA